MRFKRRIAVNLDENQHALISQAAASKGLKISSYVRSVALEDAMEYVASVNTTREDTP